MQHYDAIVVGLGAMGSAALYQLARRGQRVLGIDRFDPPHAQGSSHGQTRITRLAIGEGAHYSPLAIRSHAIWRELEADTGESLLHSVGGLIYGNPDHQGATHGVADFFQCTVQAAETHGIDHEILSGEPLHRRFPMFQFLAGDVGYFEPTAGYVRPERCIAAQLQRAKALGAETLTGQVVDSVDATANGVTVKANGQTWSAEQAIITTGPWVKDFLPASLQPRFTVNPQVLGWLQPMAPLPTVCPIFIRIPSPGERIVYGFPPQPGDGGAMKVATEQFERAVTTPDNAAPVTEDELSALQEIANRVLPFAPGCVRAVRCHYTVTPDNEFVVDRHPDHPAVIVASPCSGHGFKHSAALGEAMAEWVVHQQRPDSLAPFSLQRLTSH